MTYESFEIKILRNLKACYPTSDVSITTSKKCNGDKKGVIIRQKGKTVAPIIYLEPLFQEFTAGKSFEDILETIINTYDQHRDASPDVDFLKDWSKVKDKVVCCLINSALNADSLKERPHRALEDLTIFYKVIVKDFGTAVASIAVTGELTKTWGVSEAALYDTAIQNMKAVSFTDFSGMYCVKANHYGAAAIVNPTVREAVWEEIGNYYIIPSSIHEVLVFPEDGIDPEEINNMIKEVNSDESCISKDEILSDHAYYYSKETGFISC